MELRKQRTIAKKIFISGELEILTGLHIGGTNTGISIGGVENTVIRNIISNEPYIPGSSLKGKMRGLLEKLRGEYEIDKEGEAGPSGNLKHLSAQIFGVPADEREKNHKEPGMEETDDTKVSSEKEEETGESQDFKASRLIVRDSFLTGESRGKLLEANLELPFTETKTETSIDRVTSKANPRTIERVPQGARFKLDMILTIYSGDNEKELLDGLFTAMTLVQEDYLGGHGSRGSGKIKFHLDKISEKTNETYRNGGKENDLDIKKMVPEILRG